MTRSITGSANRELRRKKYRTERARAIRLEAFNREHGRAA